MRTDAEITDAVQQIFKDAEIQIRRKGDEVFVKVTQMYGAPEHGLGLAEFARKMTEAVGLPEVCEYDRIAESGCETCDYGSCYGTEFRFWKP